MVRKVLPKKKNSLEAETPKLLIFKEKLVRLAGIEPTTPWFVAKYSIQLSYSRAARYYSTGAVAKAHTATCRGCAFGRFRIRLPPCDVVEA